jgi:hypothetical protein
MNAETNLCAHRVRNVLGVLIFSALCCGRNTSAQTGSSTAISEIPIVVSPQVIQPVNSKLPASVNLAVLAKDCTDRSSVDLTQGYSLVITGTGLTLSPIKANKCAITSNVSIDPNAPAGNYVVLLQDRNQVPVGRAEMAILDSSSGPIPPGLAPNVDVMWEVMSQKNCADAFGRRVASSAYCIQLKIGNNSGHSLQIAGVGFSKRLDALTALGNPYVTIANSSYASTRAVLVHEESISVRNVVYNALQGAGLIMAASQPFFIRQSAKTQFLSFSTIANGPLLAAYNLIFPDPILKQLTNLDDESFRDTSIIPNNFHTQTIVFVEKEALTVSLEELSIQLANAVSKETDQTKKLQDELKNPKKSKDPAKTQELNEQIELGTITSKFTEQIKNEVGPTVNNSKRPLLKVPWKQGSPDPLLVKLALGNLVIVGDEIEYLQRVQIQSSANPAATQPSLTAAPSSLTFSNQIVTTISNPQPVTLANTGTSPQTINTPQFSGTNKGDFNVQSNSCSSSLQPGATCTLSVTFTPAAAAANAPAGNTAESAALGVSAGGGSTPVSIALTGTAVVPSNVVVFSTDPSGTLSFAAQTIGSTATATLTITNFQTTPLSGLNAAPQIAPVTAIAGDFPTGAAITNSCQASLSPTNNCTIKITFAPQPGSPGVRTANMTIAYTLSGTLHQQIIMLSGTAK